jgi:hypothetical protein
MNTTIRRSAAWLIMFAAVIFLVTLFNFQVSFAQEYSAGVGINPAVIDPPEQFKPGEVRQFSTKISNLSGIDQTYFLSKRDIIGVHDGGNPIFADQTSETTGYELSDWITLSAEEIFIPANETRDFTFLMSVPQEVSPGSHFGSLVISVEPPKLSSSGAGIGYEVANIISIRIEGEVTEKARIRQFATDKFIYGTTKVEFNARIENEGNTLVKPSGPLEIVNMFGKRVAQINFNENQSGVFPKTTRSDGLRDFTVTWEDETPGFGRYEALVSLVYGEEGKKQTISSTVTFWILPMNIVLPALGTLAILLLIIFVTVKLYVRRSLALASSLGNRRLVRTRRSGQFPTLLVILAMIALTGLFFIVLLLLFA